MVLQNSKNRPILAGTFPVQAYVPTTPTQVGMCACPLLRCACLFVCMSSKATAEAMADDTDSHPTVLLQEYTTARAIPVRTALLVQDASIVRLIRSVMSDPAFLCFWYVFFVDVMSMAVDWFVCI